MTTPGFTLDRVNHKVHLKVLIDFIISKIDDVALNTTFYIGLKDYIKDEITRMK
jgi:hypothetical protein